MTKYFKIGPESFYNSYNLTAGKYLDETSNTYGQLQSIYTLSAGDKVEITYRYVNPSLVSGSTYFFDGVDGDSERGYMLAYGGSGDINGDPYENLTLDGSPIESRDPIPHDLNEHTIVGYARTTSAGKKIHEIGRRYNGSSGNHITVVSFKINDVEQDINWFGAIDVGGESGPPLDGHFESLSLFFAAINNTSDSEKYNITHFSDNESINSQLALDINLNGNDIEFDGENKLTYNDNVATDAIIINNVGGGNCIFKNSSVSFDILKGNENAFILNSSDDKATVHHIELEGNNNNASLLYHNGTGHSVAFRNIIKNTTRGFSCNNSQGTLDLENNTIVGAEEKGVARFSGTVNIHKNYFDGNPGISGISTDDGSNFTSDTTAPAVENRNISVADAFVDPPNDYTPKSVLLVGVGPEIPENTEGPPYYAGALLPVVLGDLSFQPREYILRNKPCKIAMGIL